MCIVGLLDILKLDRVVQITFAEYHSKRNFVERVHAEPLYKHVTVGSKEHKENMEAVAEEAPRCIIHLEGTH